VLTSAPGGGLARRSGTSFAAAHVTGAAALLAAVRPSASGSRLRAALVASARRGGRIGAAIAGGQLDVTAAFERLGRLRSP
jgi:subtilisin family serine protease